MAIGCFVATAWGKSDVFISAVSRKIDTISRPSNEETSCRSILNADLSNDFYDNLSIWRIRTLIKYNFVVQQGNVSPVLQFPVHN